MIRKVVKTVVSQPISNQLALSKVETMCRARFKSRELIPHPQHLKDIENSATERLEGSFFKYALYFGCGTGELVTEALGPRCGHIWAMDVLPEALEQAKKRAPHVSTRRLRWPINITGPRGMIDLLVASTAFQFIPDDPLVAELVQHLALWLKPGARVIILDNAVDRAIHMKPRDPRLFAHGFDLRPGWVSNKVKINGREHWLLDGVRL